MLSKDRIIFIDDDPAVLDTYQSILKQSESASVLSEDLDLFDGDDDLPEITLDFEEYDVQLCDTPEQGILSVKKAKEDSRPFSAAFIDMKMPGMDGAETSKRIWEIDPDIKIVIVTAYSEYDLEELIRRAGRHDIFFLRKPFYPEEIIQFARTLTRVWNLERINRLSRKILEQTVSDKACELERKNRRLIRLDREKASFINHLSREIRTPLNWISAVSSIDRKHLDKDSLELVQVIERGSHLISGLIEETLSYFAVSDPDYRLEPVEIDLKDLVDSALAAAEKLLRPEKVDIITEIPDNTRIMSDPELISLIVSAFIRNALIHSQPDGVITINAVSEKGNILFTVKNEGFGIEPELTDTIFDPFSDFGTLKNGKNGFGLSMAKAKVAAEIQGWTVRAWSKGVGRQTGFALLIRN